MGVIAPAQHEGQESESEQCQGKKGKVGKHRKSKDREGKLVNKYLDKVSEGEKKALMMTLRIWAMAVVKAMTLTEIGGLGRGYWRVWRNLFLLHLYTVLFRKINAI